MPVLAERRADAADHARARRGSGTARGGRSSWRLKRWPHASSRCGRWRRPSDRADDPLARVAGDDRHADEVGEVARARCAWSRRASMPRSSAIGGALTALTSSSVWPLEHAEQRRDAERARVALGDAARGTRPRRGRPTRLGERRRRGGRGARHSGRNGPSTSRSSAATAGTLTARRDRAARQRGDDLLGGLVAGAVGRLGGRRAEVRRDDDVGVAEQRVLGDRLGCGRRRAPRRRPCRCRAPPGGPRRRSAGRGRR